MKHKIILSIETFVVFFSVFLLNVQAKNVHKGSNITKALRGYWISHQKYKPLTSQFPIVYGGIYINDKEASAFLCGLNKHHKEEFLMSAGSMNGIRCDKLKSNFYKLNGKQYKTIQFGKYAYITVNHNKIKIDQGIQLNNLHRVNKSTFYRFD
ncbi:hypothetical protein [Apilactobacillus xinyiensis]|uniref:hypothetical protein n=1 Tax=Apilactobacillus xinyiensis TaxID=2841032 RepID=UPI00200F8CEC|nr:hypothetical protein [Apilactobacillus xinyiensis]MCL0329824.1 hypothetical protein [Apilactobacillus xinyiensis]